LSKRNYVILVSILAFYYLTVTDPTPWENAQKRLIAAIETVDTRRSRLEPIFNPEENTMIQIIKGERGEQNIEAFREQLVQLVNATASVNRTRTLEVQKTALLALAEIGG